MFLDGLPIFEKRSVRKIASGLVAYYGPNYGVSALLRGTKVFPEFGIEIGH